MRPSPNTMFNVLGLTPSARTYRTIPVGQPRKPQESLCVLGHGAGVSTREIGGVGVLGSRVADWSGYFLQELLYKPFKSTD
jgi:hypothetical protein